MKMHGIVKGKSWEEPELNLQDQASKNLYFKSSA